MNLNSSIWGPVLRNIPGDKKTLYLTFDDGPCDFTPDVLQILSDQNIKGTFFVIGLKAKNNKSILNEVKAQGHAFGNHSLDHLYRNYFEGRSGILEWIKKSESIFSETLQNGHVGFRPPAGICTPSLHWALRELHIPLILWRKRFYDAVLPWTLSRALKSLNQTSSGDIILLHDRQPPERRKSFLETLKIYIITAKAQGFNFGILEREKCETALKLI